MPHLPPITVSSSGSNGFVTVEFPVAEGMEPRLKSAENLAIPAGEDHPDITVDRFSELNPGGRIYRIDYEEADGSVVTIVPTTGACTVKVFYDSEGEWEAETPA